VAVAQQHPQQVALLGRGADILQGRLHRCHSGRQKLFRNGLIFAELLPVLLAQHLVHLADQRLLVDLQQAAALLHVERSKHHVGNQRHTLHDLVDGRGLLHRVIAHVLHEQTCLEDQEVLRIRA
jgi:hypothetical protein